MNLEQDSLWEGLNCSSSFAERFLIFVPNRPVYLAHIWALVEQWSGGPLTPAGPKAQRGQISPSLGRRPLQLC